MNAAAARVKGQTLTSLLLYAERELPPEQYQQLLSSLPPEERHDVRRILATSTYPMRMINQITTEAARLAGRPLPEFARGAGRFNAAEGIKGVYRFFARVMTPDALLGKATTMWSSMNLAGTMTMKKEGPNHGTVWLRDYPEPEEVMCHRITGWMEHLLGLAGTDKAAVMHTRCVTHGAEACEWRVEW